MELADSFPFPRLVLDACTFLLYNARRQVCLHVHTYNFGFAQKHTHKDGKSSGSDLNRCRCALHRNLDCWERGFLLVGMLIGLRRR